LKDGKAIPNEIWNYGGRGEKNRINERIKMEEWYNYWEK
jgi:hypothetical protein